MSCVELARSFVYSQSRPRSQRRGGDQPAAGAADQRPMMTSGMYDGAGEFAYRVGMPSKSGVAAVSWAYRAGRTVDRRLVAGTGCFRQLAGGNCGAGTVVSTYRSFDF